MARRLHYRPLVLLAAVALVTVACSSAVENASIEAFVVEDAVTDVGESESVLDEVVVEDTLVDEVAEESEPSLQLVSGVELEAALVGNTVIGNWVGEDYRQFFDESGNTTYRPVLSGRESVGEWRISADTGLYESLWNDRPPWDEYQVHRDGDTWFWTGGGVELSPFTIVEGNQLDG